MYSIQSPEEVRALARQLAEKASDSKKLESQELNEMLQDYEYCLEGVRKKDTEIYVEIDT